MIPKLMPLPTTIDDRKAVTLLRCPMVRRTNPNVASVPVASAPSKAAKAATDRK